MNAPLHYRHSNLGHLVRLVLPVVLTACLVSCGEARRRALGGEARSRIVTEVAATTRTQYAVPEAADTWPRRCSRTSPRVGATR